MASFSTDADLLKTWSDNHGNECENVMFAAGNVKKSDAKTEEPGDGSFNTAGWGSNNIYTQDVWNTTDPSNPELTAYGTTCDYPASTKDSVLFSK